MKKGKSAPKVCKIDVEKGFLAVALMIFLIFPGMALVNNGAPSILSAESSELPLSLGYAGHSPIRIDNNSDFAYQAASEGWKGNGTADNPYIIEGYDINGTGYGYCIYIGNTTVQFIIRNCILHHANGNSGTYHWNSGLIMYNTINSKVVNNNASNNEYGIYLSESSSTNITNNTASSNNQYGIYLSSPLAANCTASSNNGDSVYLDYSNNISNNNASNNWGGIYIYVLSSNKIAENTVSGNHYGIYLNYSTGNKIAENTVSGNHYGIYLTSSDTNTIYHNNFINNTHQAYDNNGNNYWNASYPTCGNYWSNYNGTDTYSGPGQNETGSDGIGDTPYTDIDGGLSAKDNYPLISPYGPDKNPPEHSNEHPYEYAHELKTTIWIHLTDRSGINASTIRLYVQGFSVFYELSSIPCGYNVSYHHESGFSEGEDISCRIVAEDMYGNKLDYSWSFTVLFRKNITLHQGWNLITIRWSGEAVDINTAIDGNWRRAMVYVDGTWHTYDRNREEKYNLGFPKLNSTLGLWIYSFGGNITSYYLSTPRNTTIHLHKGWNLVGYPSGNDSKVSDALSGVPWVYLQTADADGNIYSLSSDDYLIVNRAYWIYVSEDCTWTVEK